MLGELAAQRRGLELGRRIAIQREVLAYRTSVHDFSADLEADGPDLLARVERTDWPPCAARRPPPTSRPSTPTAPPAPSP